MKQLQNVNHNFDVLIGVPATTVRKGPKWSDTQTPAGTLMELRECTGPHHDGVCNSSCILMGHAVKLGSWYGQMQDASGMLLAQHGCYKCRDIGVLYNMLEAAYAGFTGDEYVTVLIYLRVS